MAFVSFNVFGQSSSPGGVENSSFLLGEDKIGKPEFFIENSKHRIGFLMGYGDQNFGKLAMDVSYQYEAIFIQAQYYYVFDSRSSWNWELIAVPQYQKTRYLSNESISDYAIGYEVGINGGLLVRYSFLANKMSSYAMASIGPQFVSGTPDRQSDGFIFTDNFFFGLNIQAYEQLYLDFRPGFRHMSNAGLKSPNKGINNFVVYLGLMYSFR